MERNGKFALSQIGIGVVTLILTIVAIVMGVKVESEDSSKAIVKGYGIIIIIIRSLVIILGIIQIVFGAMDKMWLGMSAGITCLSSSIIGFIGVNGWIIFAVGVAVLVLNIITSVKSKSFRKA